MKDIHSSPYDNSACIKLDLAAAECALIIARNVDPRLSSLFGDIPRAYRARQS